MSNAANSMVNNANIIKKIYFPRLIIPISAILGALVDFAIAFAVFIVVLMVYHVEINPPAILLLPLSVFITCLSAMGCGLLLSAMNVKYRDVRYVIPFLMQGLLFVSPVLYSPQISSSPAIQLVLKLNPISGALELLRGLFSGYSIHMDTVLLSSAVSLLLFITGVVYFRKTERYFADLA
jgi:lipopolysaccharide transport system permease protein